MEGYDTELFVGGAPAALEWLGVRLDVLRTNPLRGIRSTDGAARVFAVIPYRAAATLEHGDCWPSGQNGAHGTRADKGTLDHECRWQPLSGSAFGGTGGIYRDLLGCAGVDRCRSGGTGRRVRGADYARPLVAAGHGTSRAAVRDRSTASCVRDSDTTRRGAVAQRRSGLSGDVGEASRPVDTFTGDATIQNAVALGEAHGARAGGNT